MFSQNWKQVLLETTPNICLNFMVHKDYSKVLCIDCFFREFAIVQTNLIWDQPLHPFGQTYELLLFLDEGGEQGKYISTKYGSFILPPQIWQLWQNLGPKVNNLHFGLSKGSSVLQIHKGYKDIIILNYSTKYRKVF